MDTKIEIYVINSGLGSESEGIWIDATLNHEWITEEINIRFGEVGDNSPVEFEIVDSKGFGVYEVDKGEDIVSVHEVACFIRRNPIFGSELINTFYGDVSAAEEAVENHYCGFYISVEAYIREYVTGMDIPEWLIGYINCSKIARCERSTLGIYTIEGYGGIYVFRE